MPFTIPFMNPFSLPITFLSNIFRDVFRDILYFFISAYFLFQHIFILLKYFSFFPQQTHILIGSIQSLGMLIIFPSKILEINGRTWQCHTSPKKQNTNILEISHKKVLPLLKQCLFSFETN